MTNSEQILKNNQRIEALIEVLKEKAVTPSGDKDPNETMYEMQEADYMRYLQGQIIRNEIPSEAEYLEQQEYVNSAIAIIMGEEFNG